MPEQNLNRRNANETDAERQSISKEDVLQAMRECEKEMGRVPSLMELRMRKGVYERHIRKYFVNYTSALAECGMRREGPGYKLSPEALFSDWAELARKLGKIPNINEYDLHSRYSHRPMVSRFGNWRQVPMGMLTLAEENGWEVEWKDVVDILREHLEKAGDAPGMFKRPCGGHSRSGIFTDRPTYGPPVVAVPLAHGPVNEAGVVFLFGMMAAQLGFVVTRIQTEFPDCEAMWEVKPGVWQRVRIEFEYESRNFVKHLHNAEECDVIVCWQHNWENCPLRVVELRKALSNQYAAFSQGLLPQINADKR